MKKVFVVFLGAAMAAGYAHAQFSFGVRAGLNLANMKVESGSASLSYDPRVGFQAGVVGNFDLGEKFALQPGILFSQQGTKIEISNSTNTLKINYLQVPVNVQYKIGLGAMDVLLQAGPYLGIALSAKEKNEGVDFDGNSVSKEEKLDIGSGDEDFLKRMDFGIGVGAGVQFGGFQVGLGYNFGLANVANTADDIDTTSKNKAFVVTATYLFGRK